MVGGTGIAPGAEHHPHASDMRIIGEAAHGTATEHCSRKNGVNLRVPCCLLLVLTMLESRRLEEKYCRADC